MDRTLSPTVEIAEQDLIEVALRSPALRALMTDILGIDPAQCLLTDESALSDFTGCGMPEGLEESARDYRNLCDLWDQWVLERIEQRFGVKLSGTGQTLLQVGAQLDASTRKPSTH